VFHFDGEQPQSGASAELTTSPRSVAAIAFSGGIDSTLLAAACPEATLYVGGFEGSHDRQAAAEVAAAMGRDLRVVEFTHETLVAAIPEVVAATGRTNPMDVAIAIPLFLVAQRAAADGADTLGVGQGADELFGGYAKMADPATDSRLDSDTVRGAQQELISELASQLERDVLTLRAAAVEPWTPFLDDRLIAAALRLPGRLLATEDRHKIALRRVADPYVPAEARDAGKKAVQYGSYVSRELDRLARQAGYKRRLDDHVGKYIRSIVADAGVTPPPLEEPS
jgi:Asparagine synthase (glutamine-hydrolyzing)